MADIVVLGDSLEKTVKTLKTGAVKQRFSIGVKVDKIVCNYDPKVLAKKPTAAILKLIRERIENIADTVKPATLKAREVARRAVEVGKPWAMKRYSGGKTGTMLPGTGDRLFNDSGRFAKGMVARFVADAGKWVIYVAQNRLNPDTVDGKGSRGGESGLVEMWRRLVQYVPELENPETLLDSIPVRRAIQESAEDMMREAKSGTLDAVLELVKMAGEALEGVDELVGELAG